MESLVAACGITLTPMERKSKMKHFLPQRAEKRKKKKKEITEVGKKKKRFHMLQGKLKIPCAMTNMWCSQISF